MSFPFDVCVPHRHKGGLYQLMMITLQIKKAHLKAQKEGLFFQNALKFGFSGRIFVRRFALFASDLRLVTFFGTGDGGLFHILFASLGSPSAQSRDPGPRSATLGSPPAQSRDSQPRSATLGGLPAQGRDPGASSATFGRSRAQSRKPGPRSATLGGSPAQGRDPGACFATFGSSPAQGRDPGPRSATLGSSPAQSRDSQPRSAPPGRLPAQGRGTSGTHLRPLFQVEQTSVPCSTRSRGTSGTNLRPLFQSVPCSSPSPGTLAALPNGSGGRTSRSGPRRVTL